MRGTHQAETYLGLTILAVILITALGWCMNVVSIFQELGGPLDAEFIARIAGIFVFPLGAILGYL